MAVSVSGLSGGTVPLEQALDHVNFAIRELLSAQQPLTLWTAALMVRVTSRASELAQH